MENIIERRQLQDRVASAMFIWRHLAAAKAFNSWRSVQRKKRSASSAPPGANTSSSTATPSPLSLRMHQSSRAHQLLGGRTGLRNLGNTCYLNSLVQALTHVPVLQHYYCGACWDSWRRRNATRHHRHVDIEDPAMLSKQLVVLFRLVCGGGHHPIRLTNLSQLFGHAVLSFTAFASTTLRNYCWLCSIDCSKRKSIWWSRDRRRQT